MNFKKLIFLIIGLIIVIGGVLGYNFYTKIYKPSVIKTGYLYIPTSSNANDIQTIVRPFLKRVKPFIWVAKKKKYFNNIKPGKYHVLKGMNNNDLVNLLRSGRQTFVNLSFNNQNSFENLAGTIDKQIEADSISLLKAFNDAQFLKENNFTKSTALAMYIPNTYEFYWNTSAESFRNKMLKAYHQFWNSERKNKAHALNLTENEVITLASIVQKETANIKERPMVAGLYLNRLRNNWPLQADPTIIYSIKKKYQKDTIIKRVLKKDLEINSAYNTYKNLGLPPGPIGMPDISSIDAVLNPTKHSYFYMCASIKNVGSHEFAKTLRQHNKNALKYQIWLNKKGVLR